MGAGDGGGRVPRGRGGLRGGVGSAVREKAAGVRPCAGVKQTGDVRSGAGGPTDPRQECALCHLRFTAAFSHDPKTLSSSFETYYQFCFHDGFVWEEERQIGRGRLDKRRNCDPSLGLCQDREKETATRCRCQKAGNQSTAHCKCSLGAFGAFGTLGAFFGLQMDMTWESCVSNLHQISRG